MPELNANLELVLKPENEVANNGLDLGPQIRPTSLIIWEL